MGKIENDIERGIDDLKKEWDEAVHQVPSRPQMEPDVDEKVGKGLEKIGDGLSDLGDDAEEAARDLGRKVHDVGHDVRDER